MTKDPVTIRCRYCDRNIDGFFMQEEPNDDLPQEIKSMDGKVIGVFGEYKGRKQFLHPACARGIEVEAALRDYHKEG